MTISTRFAGVANVLITDGESSILVDGFFSRPTIPQLALGKLHPDRERISAGLKQLGVNSLDAVMVTHSHYDHALDSPTVAEMMDATIYGSPSTRKIAEGYGALAAGVSFREMHDREPITAGKFTITPIHGLHSEPDRFPGKITEPVSTPASAADFRMGGCFSLHIAHPEGSVFVHPSANFIPGALQDFEADVVYLGIGAAGSQPEEWIREYWKETAVALSAKTVRLIHWDAFWRPLSKPLKPIPWPFDRVGKTMRIFREEAGQQVDVRLAELWKSLDV